MRGRPALFAAQEAVTESYRAGTECRALDGMSLEISMRLSGSILALLTAFTAAGCGMSEDVGMLIVDPGRYSAYHCNDLATRWKQLITRENELHALIDKANESEGGAVVGAVAYRADYQSVLTEEKLVQRAAAEKKCEIGSSIYQSDQTIH